MCNCLALSADEKNRRIELELFGRTLQAETDSEITEAVKSWRWADDDKALPRTYLRVWNHRTNTDVMSAAECADLEQHVATWRKAPRPFCGDLNLCVEVMQPRLEELGLTDEFESHFDDSPCCEIWVYLNVSAEARVDAALAALDAAGGEEGSE